jgi:predicted NAD-dependent protein-ADP-ribosyltransferase YbiA (DUF1768 family)
VAKTNPKVIASFQGKYRWLSNFYIEPDGSCVEREYQAAKATNELDRDFILHFYIYDKDGKVIGVRDTTPGESKRRGQQITCRPDWNNIDPRTGIEVKVGVMEDLVWRKFTENPGLDDLLLATNDAELIEGNNWKDRFWGVSNGEGRNELGKIIMRTRQKLRLNHNAKIVQATS